MTTDLTLHYAPDNASLCVCLLLQEMGTPYRTILVDRGQNDQRSGAYLRLNPNGLIPTLETPAGPIYETAAILLWLADQAAGTVFPGADDPKRGAALSQLFWLSNTLHATLRMVFYPEQYLPDAPVDLRTAARARFAAQLDILEPQLATMPPLPLACYLAPLLRWPALYGGDTAWFDLSKWPNLLTFAQTFEIRTKVHEACSAEGLGPTPFSAPHYPTPPEGSAT